MSAPFDTETQAIVNTIITQRNAALDQLALMVGKIAVLEADLKVKVQLLDTIDSMKNADAKDPGVGDGP